MNSKPLDNAAGAEGERAADPLGSAKAHNGPATVQWEKILLALWFILNVGIGVATVHQYGVSYDEPNNYRYAADTVSAYRSIFGILYEPAYNSTYDGHGPAFVAGVSLLVRAIRGIFPTVFQPDIWHFSYFITFQLTGLCLYVLMKRWFRAWTAWGTLILFSTQPLLLGYAFINPKDIPFMFFFTLSILLGFRLADKAEPEEMFVSFGPSLHAWTDKYGKADRPKRRFFIHLALALGAVLALGMLAGPINQLIDVVVRFFYHAAPDTWAGQLFNLVASHAHTPTASDYVRQAQRVFPQAERLALLAGVAAFLIYFLLSFPEIRLAAWRQAGQLAGGTKVAEKLRSAFSPRSLKTAVVDVLRSLRQPGVIVAGVVLGVATSIRAVAPWAGAIAFLYLFIKIRGKAWATGVAYFLVTGVVTYLTWPRLWGAPVQRFLQGLGSISNFPTAQHVLFNGRVYLAEELPRSYLLTLLNIQLTEPFLVCAYVGLGILVWQILRGRIRTDLLLYFGLGCAAPLIGWELLGSPLYDNFRHLLFLTPAMFMLAAFTFEWAFRIVTRNWVRVVLIAAIALPGVYACLTLYPYEYVYYNALVGGLAGAYTRFPTDPWQTSLREVALELNQQAPYGATVLSGYWSGTLSLYTRPDIVLELTYDPAADLNGKYDYTVDVANVKPRVVQHSTHVVYTVSRDGAILATLNAVDNTSIK